jgi:hypothetical protein
MEEAARRPPEPPAPAAPEADKGDDLVSRLSAGKHRIEVSLRPDHSIGAFKECLDRNFVLIRFPDTRGGTELGMRLDRAACDTTGADFDAGSGGVHLEADLTLNYVRVRCIADIEIASLCGQGSLRRLDGEAAG